MIEKSKQEKGLNEFSYLKIIPAFMLEKMQLVLDNLFCGVLVIDNEGSIFAFNISAEKILNVKRENVLGKSIKNIDCLKNLYNIITINEGKGRHELKLKDFNVVINLNPLIENGKTIGIIAIFHKSSTSECIVQELNVTENLLKEINIFLESSFDGIFITDKQGTVIRVNAAFERMFSVLRKDILGKTVTELMEKGIYSKSAVMYTLKNLRSSTVMLQTKGQKIMATAMPVFNEQGKLTSVVVNVRDITELENLKGQLEYQQKLTEKYSYQIKELRKRKDFPDVIMQSKEMHQVMDIVCTAAEVDSTVLITGESGVGKEVVALQVHKLSNRKNGPLIKINCGAIPPTLFESELFGYEQGAFTGAKSRGKIGFFELAHEGTLFLDEIGEIDLDTQVKLLRAIQEKEITRIGGEKPIKVDVRIVAASNRDLKKMMNEGKFRQDLYYRLNVININIPPLRERREDIVPLISCFAEKFNKKYNKHKIFSNEAVQILTQYDWPGNIRELENLVENLVVLVKNDEIMPEHLPETYFKPIVLDNNIIVKGIMPLKKALQMVEAQIIINAKEKFSTTRQMAKALEIDQSTVVRKIRQYTDT